MWLPRKERPRAGTHVQRQRSAEPQRKRPHAESLEALDADGFRAAPHEQEDRLADALVNPLHHGERGLALVESLDDGRAEPHQLPAEPVRARLRAGLDQVERLEASQQAVCRRPRLVEELGEPPRRSLADVRELLEEVDRLGERPDRVFSDLLFPRLQRHSRQPTHLSIPHPRQRVRMMVRSAGLGGNDTP